jgi:hypothetical protein
VNFEQDNEQALVTIDENEQAAGRMTLWNIESAEWVELACGAVSRNLTPTLWSQFLEHLEGRSPKQECVRQP